LGKKGVAFPKAGSPSALALRRGREVNPEEVIPMGEEEFRQF
jgi:hypothetical protein